MALQAMDNGTYDALDMMPSKSDNDDTYSRISTKQQFSATSPKVQTDHTEQNGVKNNDLLKFSGKTIVAVALFVAILLIICVSIALSIATYSRFVSYISDDHSRLDRIIQEFATVKSQFSTADSNTSRMLA